MGSIPVHCCEPILKQLALALGGHEKQTAIAAVSLVPHGS
jgi:hypothetical protein